MIRKVLFVWLLLASALLADQPPKPGTFYKFGELGIRKTEIKGQKIHLTFKPKQEDFHWCPGIKVKVTKKATVVTFVRSKTSQNASIDQKATIGNKLIRTVTIDTKGQDTYIRNGAKDFKKIFSDPKKTEKSKSPQTKKGKGKTAATKRPSAPTNSAISPRRHSMRPSTPKPPQNRMIINKFAPPSK